MWTRPSKTKSKSSKYKNASVKALLTTEAEENILPMKLKFPMAFNELIENGSIVHKITWHLSAFAIKKLFENHSKTVFLTSSRFSRVTLLFSEHAHGVLSSA